MSSFRKVSVEDVSNDAGKRFDLRRTSDPSGCIAVSSLPSLSYCCFFWRLLFVYLLLPHLLCVFLSH